MAEAPGANAPSETTAINLSYKEGAASGGTSSVSESTALSVELADGGDGEKNELLSDPGNVERPPLLDTRLPDWWQNVWYPLGLLSVAAVFLGLIRIFVGPWAPGPQVPSPWTPVADSHSWAPKAAPPHHNLTVGAVGDLFFQERLQLQAMEDGGYAGMWQNVKPLLDLPGITYGNIEGTIAPGVRTVPSGCLEEKGTPFYKMKYIPGYLAEEVPMNATCPPLSWDEQSMDVPHSWWQYSSNGTGPYASGGSFDQYNYHPQLAQDLASAGFDVVSTANEHCQDRGEAGLNATIQALQAAGVKQIGTRADPADEWHQIVKHKGWTTAWIACSDGTNKHKNHRPTDYGRVLSCWDPQYLEAVHELAARPEVHVVVAVVHWSDDPYPTEGDPMRQPADDAGYDVGYTRGAGYQREPDCAQRHFVRAVGEAGAGAVLAMHPHILQGMEKYRTMDGRKVLVAYSLGSFVSSDGLQEESEFEALSEEGRMLRRTSVMLHFSFHFNLALNRAEVSCLSYVPLVRQIVKVGTREEALEGGSEKRVEVVVADPMAVPEHAAAVDFIAHRFGFLNDDGFGGGTNQSYALGTAVDFDSMDSDTVTLEQCHLWSNYLSNNFWVKTFPTRTVGNSTGHPQQVPDAKCLKCERELGMQSNFTVPAASKNEECRWCLYHENMFCDNPDPDAKPALKQGDYIIPVGVEADQEGVAWDDCLRLVQNRTDCGPWAVAGGSFGSCQCLRPGYECSMTSSTYGSRVYVFQCPGEEAW